MALCLRELSIGACGHGFFVGGTCSLIIRGLHDSRTHALVDDASLSYAVYDSDGAAVANASGSFTAQGSGVYYATIGKNHAMVEGVAYTLVVSDSDSGVLVRREISPS